MRVETLRLADPYPERLRGDVYWKTRGARDDSRGIVCGWVVSQRAVCFIMNNESATEAPRGFASRHLFFLGGEAGRLSPNLLRAFVLQLQVHEQMSRKLKENMKSQRRTKENSRTTKENKEN